MRFQVGIPAYDRSPLILGSHHTLSDQSLAQRADEGGRRVIDQVPGQRRCARDGALMAYGLDHRQTAVAGRLCHVAAPGGAPIGG